ncbi:MULTISPECIES: 4-hydroxyphenylacetate 3-monooxygenase, reductase component [Proteus]|uniref:4-hydroxyphenylacetate 3-monooxygenase reductase component n=1 Tax=Proteus penneri TaxID=102862 RepID=A0ABS0W3L6_9GAMM|nr:MULTISPECIES: 4-hydroxyphenylacetate 3-monooxygenase, reductase component [Proteus]EEG84431.1 4-hydroxyphenylacetate 3-monooxygenase, reductase component [Proteus penneri ATCC 35198]MBJ2117500.1 4-hydroxyphenylacetate 3-monooxygenase, reductase component [Proteus penneri]NBM12772.1 4-hydroxyphenylacetate 3-monooxygenase, reductase component [Proteus sp. G2670]NBM34137.1 4-hydroxyphenylacetate 3-monooxygenase, reductase component [Proteus sp. G2664]NBM78964.1 4-hydroxyphenylacetate 3-monooxy
MSEEKQANPLFRDAMASLGAAVNIVATNGDAGCCGLTATAVCSVTDNPPTVMVCINSKSQMNSIFQENGKLSINILNHEQEEMACHFAGMTGLAMADRFTQPGWQNGQLQQPVLTNALACLEGDIHDVRQVGTHFVYMTEIKTISVREDGDGLIYFKRRFHSVKNKQVPITA